MIQKALSMLQREEIDAWMRPVWSDIRGASLRAGHPAPFPSDIAERLIKMFSFAGDTVLDPFAGSGATAAAAIRAGRNSISVEIEEAYLNAATRRAAGEASSRLPKSRTATVIESEMTYRKGPTHASERAPMDPTEICDPVEPVLPSRSNVRANHGIPGRPSRRGRDPQLERNEGADV
jgi:hypothetical protein